MRNHPGAYPGEKGGVRMKIVITKCIGCGNKRQIQENEISQGDHPCCNKCGMPMIAESAEIK